MKVSFSVFSRRGFTLFELLVVISIIGLLMALATVSFTTAQQSGRDARRRGDITGIRNALEQYYALHSAYPSQANCAPADITDVLLNGFPTDPQTGVGYTVSCTATTYCACALLERETTGNAGAVNCSDMTPGAFFCAANLQ